MKLTEGRSASFHAKLNFFKECQRYLMTVHVNQIIEVSLINNY